MCYISIYQNINDYKYKVKHYYSALNAVSEINVTITAFLFIM